MVACVCFFSKKKIKKETITLSKEINNRYPTQRERYKERPMPSETSDKKNDRVEKILSARNMTFDEKVQALCRLGDRER